MDGFGENAAQTSDRAKINTQYTVCNKSVERPKREKIWQSLSRFCDETSEMCLITLIRSEGLPSIFVYTVEDCTMQNRGIEKASRHFSTIRCNFYLTCLANKTLHHDAAEFQFGTFVGVSISSLQNQQKIMDSQFRHHYYFSLAFVQRHVNNIY